MKTKIISLSLIVICALGTTLLFTSDTAAHNRESWVTASSQASQRCLPVPAGLTGWWPGDGNTQDIASERDAMLHGDAGFGPGLVGQAFHLDGDGDFVSVSHDPALNVGTGDFTVTLWVYFNDTAGEQVLVEKWVQGFSGPSTGWTLTKLEDNVLRLAMSSGGGFDINADSAPLSLRPGTWIHFAATRKSGKVTTFMNGQPVSEARSRLNLDSDSSLKFGHRGNPDDTPGSEDERGFSLNGRVDEVALLIGRALPHKQVQAILNAGSAGMCKDQRTLLDLSFEGTFLGAEGEVGTANGVTFVPGYNGQGVLFDNADTLTYATEGNIIREQGSIEYWLQPLWDGNDEQSYVFFEIGVEWFNRLRTMKDGANNFRFIVWSPNNEYGVSSHVADWKVGEWHHVRVTWTTFEIALYLDGDLKDVRPGSRLPGYLAPTINLGFTAIEPHKANAVIDEFKIFTSP